MKPTTDPRRRIGTEPLYHVSAKEIETVMGNRRFVWRIVNSKGHIIAGSVGSYPTERIAYSVGYRACRLTREAREKNTPKHAMKPHCGPDFKFNPDCPSCRKERRESRRGKR